MLFNVGNSKKWEKELIQSHLSKWIQFGVVFSLATAARVYLSVSWLLVNWFVVGGQLELVSFGCLLKPGYFLRHPYILLPLSRLFCNANTTVQFSYLRTLFVKIMQYDLCSECSDIRKIKSITLTHKRAHTSVIFFFEKMSAIFVCVCECDLKRFFFSFSPLSINRVISQVDGKKL